MVQSPPTCENGVGQVTVNWTEPTDTGGINVDHYEVDVTGPAGQLDDVSCSSDPDCGMVEGLSTTISNLDCGITYTVEVRAVHCLNGTYSNATDITVPSASECCIHVEVVSGENNITLYMYMMTNSAF